MVASTKSKVTTDHEEIRRWAAERNGKPAVINRSKGLDQETSLCIHFPGDHANGLGDEISWRDWFKRFEAAGLALLYQEHTANGEKSNFNKLVKRKIVDMVEEAVGGKGRSASRKSSLRRREVRSIAAPFDAKSQRDTRSAVSRRIGKKSTAGAAIVTPAKKQKSTKNFLRADKFPGLASGNSASRSIRRSSN